MPLFECSLWRVGKKWSKTKHKVVDDPAPRVTSRPSRGGPSLAHPPLVAAPLAQRNNVFSLYTSRFVSSGELRSIFFRYSPLPRNSQYHRRVQSASRTQVAILQDVLVFRHVCRFISAERRQLSHPLGLGFTTVFLSIENCYFASEQITTIIILFYSDNGGSLAS